jgi:Tfp pilus assembly protein PilF
MMSNTKGWMALALTGVVVLAVGCHFPGFRSAGREPAPERDRSISGRQVADVQLSLARTLERRGDMEPALAAYRQAIEKDPRRSTGYWRMAIIQDRRGNTIESEGHYQQALKLDAKNPDLLCDYGYSLYLQRRWAESEENLRRAITLKPQHQRAHNNLGLLLAQGERNDDALTEFRKAGCDIAEARCNLAFVMALNRRFEGARQFYELALDANPESSAAKSGLETLESVIAKASPADKSIELTNYETPAKSNSPTTINASARASDNIGRASISTSSRRD